MTLLCGKFGGNGAGRLMKSGEIYEKNSAKKIMFVIALIKLLIEPHVKVYVRREGVDNLGCPKLRSTTLAFVNRTPSNFKKSFGYS